MIGYDVWAQEVADHCDWSIDSSGTGLRVWLEGSFAVAPEDLEEVLSCLVRLAELASKGDKQLELPLGPPPPPIDVVGTASALAWEPVEVTVTPPQMPPDVLSGTEAIASVDADLDRLVANRQASVQVEDSGYTSERTLWVDAKGQAFVRRPLDRETKPVPAEVYLEAGDPPSAADLIGEEPDPHDDPWRDEYTSDWDGHSF